MTESLYLATTTTGHEPVHASLPNGIAFARNNHVDAPVQHITHEDDGQISCFCGFNDDDGNTVACDQCNRWQHTLCYYPQYEGRDLPADMSHFCVECKPRPVNQDEARSRQWARREHQDSYNGMRRQVSKSHKKKAKDIVGPSYSNGWPLDKARHDRNSASPRDQPPPAKRPKTSHRGSDNVATAGKCHSRKRTATNAHRRSESLSPESPIGLYSEEFLRCYHGDPWEFSASNVMDHLRVTNDLSRWLQASDDDFVDELGARKQDLLLRWDRAIEDIPGQVALDVQEHHDPNIQDQDGQYPMWKSITVRDPLAPGAYIGELRGRIGFKSEYKADPANRWSTLRHPEPFVFFHPRLPIYIDARNEGTNLRFVRRSCTPNARLQILVTNGSDYHFCFMAITQIDPGMEVSVGWDTADSILQPSGSADFISSISQQDMAQLSTWVSTVLANCGPCACQQPTGSCYMSRFDRRCASEEGDESQYAKPPKSKKKKAGHHISPLSTHAHNSRSGSEARKIEPDDEPADSRSASGSAGRNSSSRDNTPNTHYSTNGQSSMMPELSERERKKLAKEEEMFRRQEEEMSGKQAKKKRHSAGSSATTPALTSSKHMSAPHHPARSADAGTSKQMDLPATRTTTKRPKNSVQKPLGKAPHIKIVKRPKPNYVDSETQCDMDAEDAHKREAEAAAVPRKRYISLTQRLLQRCATNNYFIHKAASPVKSPRSTLGSPEQALAHGVTVETVAVVSAPQEFVSHQGSPVPKAEVDDVDMTDAPPTDGTTPLSATTFTSEAVPKSDPHSVSQESLRHQPETHVPPWSPQPPEASHATDHDLEHPHKHVELHVQMPPPPTNPFAQAHVLNGNTPNSIMQSPMSLTPSNPNPHLLFSPAVNAAVTPSPARKKMSLSEYRQRKNKDRESESKGDRESSPASVASGPTAMPIGLLHSNSEAGGQHSQAVEDDVKMEDIIAVAAAGER